MIKSSKKVDISPLNNMNGNMCMVIPVAPGDLWLYDTFNCTIFDWSGTIELTQDEDDRGLYHRLSTVHYIGDNDGDVRFVLFGCPSVQEGIPAISNKIIVYDTYDHRCKTMSPTSATRFIKKIGDFGSVISAPFVTEANERLDSIYNSDSPILRWGRAGSNNPLLLRTLLTGKDPYYRLVDPFMQWAPARFLQMGDELEHVSTDTENWVAMIVDSLNWDYFASVYNDNKSHKLISKDIAAAIFDMLYTDYIYPSICKRIWPNEAPGRLAENGAKHAHTGSVIINFTDIVNLIRLKIARHLRRAVDDKRFLPQAKNTGEGTIRHNMSRIEKNA